MPDAANELQGRGKGWNEKRRTYQCGISRSRLVADSVPSSQKVVGAPSVPLGPACRRCSHPSH
eukprot:567302-Rhodomonas_salina.3